MHKNNHSHIGSWKLNVMFSISVFLIMTITMFAMGGFFLILFHIGIIHMPPPKMLLFYFALISIIAGTIFSKFIANKFLSPIIAISNATQEIAKGNFNLRLEEKSNIYEVQTMAESFNIMTQELANTEIFRNDFINNVSHEFKTPLSSIEGYATLLQNRSLTEEKRELYVSKIIYNTRRLSSLTGNILQLSKLETQDILNEKQSFSLDEQIREMILLFEDEWNRKNIDIDINLETISYFGNEELLSQVWQNLIGNAVKFVNNNGIIEIILKKKTTCIFFKISNTGPVIPDNAKKHIFEKFYQADTSHATEGNGLGLALAKCIVELHQGKIYLEDGTTFVVELPLHS